jgi:hypothetical protein
MSRLGDRIAFLNVDRVEWRKTGSTNFAWASDVVPALVPAAGLQTGLHSEQEKAG